MRWAPERVKDKWESLEGCTWDGEYAADLQQMGMPPAAVGPFLRSASDGLASPMTILWALEKLKKSDAWTNKHTLTIHVRLVVSAAFILLLSLPIDDWSKPRGAHASYAV